MSPNDEELTAFMLAVAPRLRLSWAGYRRVRGTVRKRLRRRLAELGLADLDAYRSWMAEHASEWPTLDAICRIPISRWVRDRGVYDVLVREILPERARVARSEARGVRVLSAGCASGEEPYSVSLAWQVEIAPAFADVACEIVASDLDEAMLARAVAGCYERGSLREVPERWIAAGFVPRDDLWCVRDDVRARVRFERRDLRDDAPDGPFDVVLCRNSAFTYFDDATRVAVAQRISDRLRPGGALVVGAHEKIPQGLPFEPRARSTYTRASR